MWFGFLEKTFITCARSTYKHVNITDPYSISILFYTKQTKAEDFLSIIMFISTNRLWVRPPRGVGYPGIGQLFIHYQWYRFIEYCGFIINYLSKISLCLLYCWSYHINFLSVLSRRQKVRRLSTQHSDAVCTFLPDQAKLTCIPQAERARAL